MIKPSVTKSIIVGVRDEDFCWGCLRLVGSLVCSLRALLGILFQNTTALVCVSVGLEFLPFVY